MKREDKINNVLCSLTTITSLINALSIFIGIGLIGYGIKNNLVWCFFAFLLLWKINNYLWNVSQKADSLRTDLSRKVNTKFS